MYENFAFPERDKAVTGYHFSCENPSHVLCLIHGIGEHAGRQKQWSGHRHHQLNPRRRNNRISLRCAVDGFDIGTAIYKGSHPDNGGAADKPLSCGNG